MNIIDTAIFFFAQVIYIFAPVISVILCDSAKKKFRSPHLRMNSPMGYLLAFGQIITILMYTLPAINTIFKFNPWNFYVYSIQYYISNLTPFTTLGWFFFLCWLYSENINFSRRTNSFGIVTLPWMIIVIICHLVFITKSITIIKQVDPNWNDYPDGPLYASFTYFDSSPKTNTEF